MYFADLTPYRYLSEDSSLSNVGWLDGAHPFESGATPEAFVERLAHLSVHSREAKTRGIHICELCDPARAEPCYLVVGGERHLLGTAEIHIGGFAAPSLLLHYVVDHRYRPPVEFVEAVMAHTESLPRPTWNLTLRPPFDWSSLQKSKLPVESEPVDLDQAVLGELVSSIQVSIFRRNGAELEFSAIATAHVWDAEVDAPPLRPYQKYLAAAVLQSRSGRGSGPTQELATRAALSGLFFQLGAGVHSDQNKKEGL